MTDSNQNKWITDMLMGSTSTTPAELLEEVMADPRRVAFGPVHHYIVGGVLLACWRNVEASPNRDSLLAADLEKMTERSKAVPGAACAHWGVCGAAASAGMAYAIIRNNVPLQKEGWAEGQLLVSHLLTAIAHAGTPRCCKRDARVAIREAIRHFNDLGGPQLKESNAVPTCASFSANTACIKEACPYFPTQTK